jgi:hypothetical protein
MGELEKRNKEREKKEMKMRRKRIREIGERERRFRIPNF